MKLKKYSWIITVVMVAIIIVIGFSFRSQPKNSQFTGAASIILGNLNSATVEVGDPQNINWTSVNYASPTVTLNIIRKVSENPARYELVRTVSVATKNDGTAVWVPAKTDIGSNTFVQVGCTFSPQECHGSQPTIALAVVDTGRYANTANSYQAIEQLNNK